MSEIQKVLESEKQRLEQLLRKAKKELQKTKPDDYRVKASLKGRFLQLYLVKDSNNSNNQTTHQVLEYLPTTEKNRAVNIVKREYLIKTKNVLEKRIKIINNTLKGLKRTEVASPYRNLGKAKQMLVTPIEEPIEQYRARWESVEYEGKPFQDNMPSIFTEKGERVRSKSEKMIADKLFREGISYRYEYPFEVPYVATLYPDFTILDEENRRNIILEHFGLMDDPSYADSALRKIRMYAKEGYVIGDNLFITMESSQWPFDGRTIDGIIAQIKHKKVL